VPTSSERKFHAGQKVTVLVGTEELPGAIVAADPLWGGKRMTDGYAVLVWKDGKGEILLRYDNEMKAATE
jgi:hypothetical protein